MFVIIIFKISLNPFSTHSWQLKTKLSNEMENFYTFVLLSLEKIPNKRYMEKA